MGLRFRKSFSLGKGARINLGKKSISASVGIPGLRATIGTSGTRGTIGAPGTGLSYTAQSRSKAPDPSPGGIKEGLFGVFALGLLVWAIWHAGLVSGLLGWLMLIAFFGWVFGIGRGK
jgi:hypothetical protein